MRHPRARLGARTPKEREQLTMPRNRPVLLVAILVSLAVGAALPGLLAALRGRGPAPETAGDSAATDGPIKLSAAQIEASKITLAKVGAGVLTRLITVPATVTPDPDRLARVAAKVAGTVAELRKRLGDDLRRDETIAIVDSREVADAKSEYLAAAVNADLQSKLFQREKGLFDKKITAEQLFLKARTTFAEAKLRLDLARQKLAALDLSESEIANLATQPIAGLRAKEIRAPIAGRVIERLVNLGQPVTAESQLYVISDLSVVEADLSVPLASLAAVRDGQPVRLVNNDGRAFEGKVAIVSAVVTAETRAGHVIASFKNSDFALRPGMALNAEIELAQTRVALAAPRAAVQLIHNEPYVFVRTADGFEKRRIVTGIGDDDEVEVTGGLTPGETIAVANSFVLKAEAGKHEIPEE